MRKPRVAPDEKRIIISARVTPLEKDTLMAVGNGNISKGLDLILTAMTKVWESAPQRPAVVNVPTSPTF